jgi:hypothetical protein
MKIELAEDSFMRYFRDISHLKSVVKENMVLTVMEKKYKRYTREQEGQKGFNQKEVHSTKCLRSSIGY